MRLKEISTLIEGFESILDRYLQSLKGNNGEIYSQLSSTWKNMQVMQIEKDERDAQIKEQVTELTAMRTKSEEFDKKIEELKSKKADLTTKISELKSTLEKATDDLNKPKFELENLTSKLETTNEKIISREAEKDKLEQKRFENENKETELKDTFSKKMEILETTLNDLKSNNFFTSFVIDHSDEDIHEVDILSRIIEQGKINLNDLKQQLDIPPIMAVRTIKQLAVKEIINLNEDTNEITMP